MPDTSHLAAIDTLLAVLITFLFAFRVAMMRGRHGIKAPATSGHPDFERAFRVHANTVENLVLVVPLLWIASAYYGGQIPFWIGLAWVISRVVYAIGYIQSNAQLRAPGGIIGFLSIVALFAFAALGVSGH